MNPVVRLSRDKILRLLDGFRVQCPTEVGLLEFVGVSMDPWIPMRRLPVSAAIAAHHGNAGLATPDETWLNNLYDCFVKHSPDGFTHLSIKRLDRAPIRNWRHFQQIKNEVVGEEREAVEIYPAESRLADNANQYHLWVLPEGLPVGVGFSSGMVVMDEDDVETFNRNGDKGRQEPLQEGLTIGEKMQVAQDNMSEDAQAGFQRVLRGNWT